jgi:hypothetical protein
MVCMPPSPTMHTRSDCCWLADLVSADGKHIVKKSSTRKGR